MADIDKEILNQFQSESKGLIEEGLAVLEEIEGDFSLVRQMEDYGNKVDRIMGGAQSLAILAGPEHALAMIGDYAALCKAVGYKTSQINNNPQLFDIAVALLMDATETLRVLVDRAEEPVATLKQVISSTFIDRLNWVNVQFKGNFRSSISADGGSNKMNQSEIDDLMKKLGLS